MSVVGDLTWELVDLSQQPVALLSGRDSGQVLIGREVPRTASLTLDIDDAAVEKATVGDTVLRCTASGWERPVFCGRVIQTDLEYDGDDGVVKLSAADPLFHLASCLVFSTAGMSPAAETFLTYFSNTDTGQIMWDLINTVLDNGVGIRQGTLVGGDDLKLGFPAGTTIADALRSVAGLDGAPEFEFAPVVASDGTLVEFNTYYPKQGTDKRSTIVLRLGSGGGDELLGIELAPSMSGLSNRHVVVGDAPDGSTASSTVSGSTKLYPLHPANRASHAGSIAQYGVWESTEAQSGVTDAGILSRVAKQHVAANRDPISSFRVTLDPDFAPSFGPDGAFYIGDIIAVELTTPAGKQIDLDGRVASTSLTEADNGDVLVDLLLEPEDDAVGVTTAGLSVVMDSSEGTDPPPPPPPEPDPCAPAADAGGPTCPDAGGGAKANKKKKKKKKR